MSDTISEITQESSEVKQVQLPFRSVHNRGSFYLRQHVQSEVRQVEELTEHMVRMWFENPREFHRQVCEVINASDTAFKFVCHMTKRMMYFCGFNLRYSIKHKDTKTFIVYEWSPMSVAEQKKMDEHEKSIMPTKEQLEEQRRRSTAPAPAPAPAPPAPEPAQEVSVPEEPPA